MTYLIKIWTFLGLSLLAINPIIGQGQAPIDIQVDVVYLASDYLEGRETGKRGEKLAAEYLAFRFEKLGLQPKGTDGFFQPFDFTFKDNPHAEKGESRTGMNVIGFLDNGAENTIVIGAHYDHLGLGGSGSRHVGDPAVHNGADDNASGVAAMLQLAADLKKGQASNNNYLFIGFSGEELGLYGSKYFVNNPTIELSKINYLINMDMIGRLNEEKMLLITGAGTSPAWKETLHEVEFGGIKIKTSDSGVGPSDHTSFYLKDIPVLHLWTGQHMDYHKPADDAILVNYQGIYDISQFVLALITKLDKKGKLVFQKTKDEQEDRKVSAFKVTLGVMPDYVFEGQGMRIDAVIDDRPASKAGLENGDVVIQIGELKVTDIYSYMEALSKFEKGSETKVIVERDGKKIKKKVVF